MWRRKVLFSAFVFRTGLYPGSAAMISSLSYPRSKDNILCPTTERSSCSWNTYYVYWFLFSLSFAVWLIHEECGLLGSQELVQLWKAAAKDSRFLVIRTCCIDIVRIQYVSVFLFKLFEKCARGFISGGWGFYWVFVISAPHYECAESFMRINCSIKTRAFIMMVIYGNYSIKAPVLPCWNFKPSPLF